MQIPEQYHTYDRISRPIEALYSPSGPAARPAALEAFRLQGPDRSIQQRARAVLVRLSEQHGDKAEAWFLEASFRRLSGVDYPVFADLVAAQDWFSTRVAQQALATPRIP